MNENMAVGDRFIRFVLAVMIVIFFTKEIAAPYNYLLLVIAAIFGVTAYTGRCPLYALLRIDTRQLTHCGWCLTDRTAKQGKNHPVYVRAFSKFPFCGSTTI